MKKYFGAVLAALLFVGCAEKIEVPQEPDSPAGQVDFEFEITAGKFESRTINDGLNTSWAANDAIQLFAGASNSANYAAAGEFTTVAADGKFTGKLDASLLEGAHDWLAVYPSVSTQKVNFSTELIQFGDKSKSHLSGENFPMYACADNQIAEELKMNMKQMAAVLEVTVTNTVIEPLELKTLSLTAEEPLAGEFDIIREGDELKYVPVAGNGNKTVTLSLQSPITLAQTEQAVLYIAFKPFSIPAGGELTLSVNDYAKPGKILKQTDFKSGVIRTAIFNYDKGTVTPEPPVEEWNTWNGQYDTDFSTVTGAGTKDDPYQIRTAADFAAFANKVNTTNGNSFNGQWVRLEVNIDLNNNDFRTIGTQNGAKAFNGTFDGNGHTIKNIKIVAADQSRPENNQLGLFKWSKADTKVLNLTLENVTADAKDAAGALFGQVPSMKCVIENVTVINPNITSVAHAGGLIGIGGNNLSKSSDFIVKNCHVYGGIVKANNAGGIIGTMQAGTLLGCSTALDIEGNNIAGGILAQGYMPGVNDAAYKCDNVIVACYTKSNIQNNKNVQASGIAGTYKGQMDASYSVSVTTLPANPAVRSHNNVIANCIYRVTAAPAGDERLPERVHNCYCPGSLEPIHQFQYQIFNGKMTFVDKMNIGYWALNAEGKNQPKASYMEMKRPTEMTQVELDKMNVALEAFSTPEYQGINGYQFELSPADAHGFPAILVKR